MTFWKLDSNGNICRLLFFFYLILGQSQIFFFLLFFRQDYFSKFPFETIIFFLSYPKPGFFFPKIYIFWCRNVYGPNGLVPKRLATIKNELLPLSANDVAYGSRHLMYRPRIKKVYQVTSKNLRSYQEGRVFQNELQHLKRISFYYITF